MNRNPQKPEFLDNTLQTAVVVSCTPWCEVPRFRHQVTRQLIRFYNVLYIVLDLNNETDKHERLQDRLFVFTPAMGHAILKRLYWNEPITHNFINFITKRKILGLLDLIRAPKLLFNFEFDFFQLLKSQKAFQVCFYICNDEFPKMLAGFSRLKAKAWFQERLFNCYERKVIKSADYCLAPHTPLVNKIKRLNKHTELFLPGHEFNLPNVSIPIRSRQTPIKIGYMGFITYYLLADWLLAIAKSDDMVLHMVGPVEKFDSAKFNRYRTVKLFAPMQGQELQSFLDEMDVLIIPYDPKQPPVKVQTAPNKFFQYVAAGKPIVISDMPHFLNMPKGIIYKARNAEEFVDKIRDAFFEDSEEYIKLRLRIAADNSWDKRGDYLYQLVTNLINNKGHQEQ